MISGDFVVMNHPGGYATIEGKGGAFVGWIPNGVTGVVYLMTPGGDRAVVNFDGRMLATVPTDWLTVQSAVAA